MWIFTATFSHKTIPQGGLCYTINGLHIKQYNIGVKCLYSLPQGSSMFKGENRMGVLCIFPYIIRLTSLFHVSKEKKKSLFKSQQNYCLGEQK